MVDRRIDRECVGGDPQRVTVGLRPGERGGGRAELIDGSFAVEDHLVIEPAPGHTPGHIVLKLNCADATAIFCGDVVHHPIQICEPDWNTQFCIDQRLARETRRRILNEAASDDGWLFPTHFVHPYACKIAKTETSFMPVFDVS